MNILFTVEYYYPKIGGAEIVVQTIAEYFASKGDKVYVATSYLEDRKTRSLNGVEIFEFNIKGNSVKGIKEFTKGDIKRYQRLLTDGGFDIIFQYAAQTWHTSLMFDVINSVKSKKLIVPCGYSGLSTFFRKLIYFKYFKDIPRYLCKYDMIIYHSNNYIDYEFGKRHNLYRYKTIPIGIDQVEFKSAYEDDRQKFREKYQIDTRYTVLNVSNHYSRVKGHNFAIKTLEALLKLEKDVTLIIIGNLPENAPSCFPRCFKYSKVNDRFKLLTDIPRKDITKAYLESDVFLLSSKMEYFPIVILEAMATNLPYVSRDVGCVKSMGKGIIVHDPKQASEMIEHLIKEPTVRKYFNEYNQNMINNNFDINIVLKLYEETFMEILNS